MKRFLTGVGVAVIALAFVLGSQAQAWERKVDCDRGHSIQKVLDRSYGFGKAIEISISGTCVEDVTITKERVVIDGNDEATIHGTIRMFGRNSATMRDFVVTGPGDGIAVYGGRVRLLGVDFIQNDGVAVYGRDDAAVVLRNNEITENYGPFAVLLRGSTADMINTNVYTNFGGGIAATQGSSLGMAGGMSNNNQGNGIEITVGSAAALEGTGIGDNDGIGVFVGQSSGGEFHNVIFDYNTQQGLHVNDGSSVVVSGERVTDNLEHGVYVSLHSTARFEGTEIYGNTGDGIVITQDSGVFVGPGTWVPADVGGVSVRCNGKESSVEVDDAATAPVIDCPDQDF